MMLGNFGVLLMAPVLSVSSFMGWGANDGSIFAQANANTNWRESISEWRDTSTDRNWNWGGDFMRKPAITNISPDEGDVGTEVTLTGRRFDDDSVVRMGQGAIHDVEVSNNGRTLSFIVPEYMGQYCPPDKACIQIAHEVTPGDYEVRVVTDERTSNSVTFTVTEDDEQTSGELNIASINGPTALAVDAEGTWTVNVEGAEGNLSYSAKWGDEGMMRSMLSLDDEGQASATFTHTYTDAGIYTPEFTVTDEDGETVTKVAAKVTVGENGDVIRVDKIEPASAQSGATITLTGVGFDGQTKVWVGRTAASDVKVTSDSSLTFKVPAMAVGNHNVRVASDEGTSNSVALEILKAVKARLSVSGVDAPSRLTVDQEGTWTVRASSNTSGNLSYSVDWGEDKGWFRALSGGDVETQSSATFTHSYSEAGTYYPKFTVTDENGNKSSVSASVVVR